jgi:hypothetical protein
MKKIYLYLLLVLFQDFAFGGICRVRLIPNRSLVDRIFPELPWMTIGFVWNKKECVYHAKQYFYYVNESVRIEMIKGYYGHPLSFKNYFRINWNPSSHHFGLTESE